MAGSGKELVPVKRPVGRPRGSKIYSEEIAEEIIDRLSHGETLISICRETRDGQYRYADGSFPSHVTVYDWADPNHTAYIPAFALRFARAKLDQQRYWLEECHDIAYTPEPGEEEVREISAKNGASIRRTRKDMLHHRVLKIDTNLKLIARMNPALWSERLQQATPSDTDPTKDPPRLIIEGGLPETEGKPTSPDDGSNTENGNPV